MAFFEQKLCRAQIGSYAIGRSPGSWRRRAPELIEGQRRQGCAAARGPSSRHLAARESSPTELSIADIAVFGLCGLAAEGGLI